MEGKPGKAFGTVQLSTELPQADETVVIAQHPRGEVKKVDLGPTRCKTAVCGADDGKIYYSVDTEPGSSGSPVALADQRTVIGIHTNGNLSPEFPANSAVSIRAIKQFSRVLANSKLGFFQPLTDSRKIGLNESYEFRY